MTTDAKPIRSRYNTTQLNVEHDFAKHQFHRDRFAHYLRWSFVLRHMKPNEPNYVLDAGCGDANLLKVLYVNRRHPDCYLGLDVRKKEIENLQKDWAEKDWANFTVHDLCTLPAPQLHEAVEASDLGMSDEGLVHLGSDYPPREWTYVTCFEVMEHVGKWNGPAFLKNIKAAMGRGTVLFLSTPCYDPNTGAADNHMIVNPATGQPEVGEWGYGELRDLLHDEFSVVASYGTFASKKDVMAVMDYDTKQIYGRLEGYYNADLLSVMFAPLYPAQSRNCLWVLRLKP